MSKKQQQRIKKLKEKMNVASTIYRRLRQDYPELEQWKMDEEGDYDSFSSWRQVWQMVVSFVMRGLWTIKTRFLRGPELVFSANE